MKSYEVQDHGVSDRVSGQAKKPWVAPSLQIIALESAESASASGHTDLTGAHSQYHYS